MARILSTKKKRRRPHNHIRHYESGRKTSVNKHIPIPKRYKKITKHQFLYSDFDRDGVKNKDDCYPFDRNRQDEYDPLGRESEEREDILKKLKKKKKKLTYIQEQKMKRDFMKYFEK